MAEDANTFNKIFAWAMTLEDQLYADGKLNQYSYAGRELTDFCTRKGTIIEVGGREQMVLKEPLDEKSGDKSITLPASFDLREAALKYLELKPHWGIIAPEPLDGNAAKAFGLDGHKPTLEAQRVFLQVDCGGSVELAQAKAKEFGTSLGSLKPGRRPDTDKTKAAPALDAVRKNPWLLDNSNPAAIEKRIGIIRDLGTSVAAGLAKAAGKTLAGQPLNA